jgi:hypothetical protein
LFFGRHQSSNGQRLVRVVVPYFLDALFAKDSGSLDTSLQWHNRARLKFHRPRRREAAGGHSCQLNREMDDCRRYAANQKAKYDDDDRFSDSPPALAAPILLRLALHRFAFMSASAGYPRFFKASSTPSMSRSWILRLSSKATCRSAS